MPAEDPPTVPVIPAEPGEVPAVVIDAPPARAAVEPEPQQPAKWAGRVVVPGAAGPGQKKKAAGPLAATQRMMAYSEPAATRVGPRAALAQPRAVRPPRRRGGFRRFLGALFALVLLLAVPVVSAYVAYKLALGESPFEWPPTMDLSRVF